MPFKPRDSKKEKLEKLLNSSKEARKACEEFDAIFNFRLQLV